MHTMTAPSILLTGFEPFGGESLVLELDLPAGQTVELKPGGYHVMLMDLKQPLLEGQSVALTLVVEGKDKKRETLEIKAPVRAADTHLDKLTDLIERDAQRTAQDAMERQRADLETGKARGLVMGKHGIAAWGGTPKECYDNLYFLVVRAEARLQPAGVLEDVIVLPYNDLAACDRILRARKDEIGELSGAFNTMAAELESMKRKGTLKWALLGERAFGDRDESEREITEIVRWRRGRGRAVEFRGRRSGQGHCRHDGR